MKLTINLNLPRFDNTVTAEVELYYFQGDPAVGVDDMIDIESILINGAEMIDDLTWEELYSIEKECWKYKDSGRLMDFSYINNVENEII